MKARIIPIAGVCLGLAALAQCSKGSVPLDMVLEVSPRSVSFGTVIKGDTADRSVTLKHEGTSGVIRLEGFDWKAGSSAEFTYDPPQVMDLSPGGQTTITFHYSPVDSTPDSGTLVVRHNVPPDYVTEIPVSALAQVAHLASDPRDIDFGEVRGGEYRDLVVKVVNVGSDSISILKAPYLADGGSADFTIEGEPVTPGGAGYPLDLQPDQAIEMTMRYTPRNGGADDGTLAVETLFQGTFDLVQFPVRGREVGPHLVISPGVVDFGVLQLNASAEIPVTVDNEGFSSHPKDSLLVIPAGGIELAEGSDEELVLIEAEGGTGATKIPASEWTLKAEEYPGYPDYADYPQMETFAVRWTAKNPKPDDGLPIGVLVIQSNDKGSGLVTVEIRGRIAVPMVDVFPQPVNFLSVALGIEAKQTVRIVNNGNGPLLFTSPIEVTDDALGEFSVVTDATFLPTKPGYDAATDCPVAEGQEPPAGCAIPAGSFREVVLKFKNLKDQPYEQVRATLWVRTNAYNQPEVAVDLLAKRAEAPTCVPKFAPANANFGAVLQGESATRTLFLVNEGTGYCSFQGCTVSDCPTLASFINICSKGFGGSKYFKIKNPQDLPSGLKDGMLPNSKYPVQIQFDSPLGEFLFTNFYGLLSCQVYDGYQQQTVEVPARQSGVWGDGYPVNLTAVLGYVNIVVTPKSLDFGLQYAGCASVPKKVTIRNTGNSPLTLKRVSFHGCTPEMKALTALPPDNTMVNPSTTLDVSLNYVPQQAGEQTCYLKIESNDLDEPVVYVKLHGEGTLDKTITDRFKQVSGKEFDLLIVQDDCACTLMDYGMNIRDAMDDFIQHGAIWDKDFHIGVIIVLIDDKKKRGCLNEGNPAFMPRYVTPATPDAKGKFKAVFEKVIEVASSDSLTKGGLLASYLAVTEPLTVQTTKPCTSDGDCLGDPTICPDPAACDFLCMEGFCGGYNWGFYRPDAYLDMVYISKADDNSPGTLNDYRELLNSVKGPANKDFIRLHSVTWEAHCEGHAGHGEGKRYIAMSKEFGGQQAIICEDFAPLLNQIASGGNAPLKKQFFLSGLPSSPTTIQVSVGGKACPTGWSYDLASNSIIFDPAGSCMPAYSQEIEVTYDASCGT